MHKKSSTTLCSNRLLNGLRIHGLDRYHGNELKAVAVTPGERETLDNDVWPVLVSTLDAAGINAWQFVSWLSSVLPEPTTLLPIAALCVERRNFIKQIKEEMSNGCWLDLTDHTALEQLQQMLPARIALQLAFGTATRSEMRGAPLNDSTIIHRFVTSLMCEFASMHGMCALLSYGSSQFHLVNFIYSYIHTFSLKW